MTIHVPLNANNAPSPSPPFLVPSTHPAAHLTTTIRAILKARRIVVICGAGISVQAGIPDFRSADGLFQSIKRDNPKEAMSSGKELFDVSVFNSEQKTSLFCQMIAQLSDLSQAAEPTSFHRVLRALDDSGKLLRVYTQNIDAIEQKSGLSFGVPGYEPRRSSKSKKSSDPQEDDNNHNTNDSMNDTTTTTPQRNKDVNVNPDNLSGPTFGEAEPSTSRLPSPPAETPRCIPLHGTLQSMHCQICNHTFPLLEYLPSLSLGVPPPCPECTSLEATRQLIGKRPRGIGRLRPSVVLYNEMHKDGEGVGEIVRRDLMGGKCRGMGTGKDSKRRGGADLLLVVGTSLRVPGTKRMVREFAKAVKARGGIGGGGKEKEEQSTNSGAKSGLATPAPSPRRSPTADEEPSFSPTTAKSIKAVYLNLDFPVPTREWEGVFDAWIQGDAQEFAEVLTREIGREKEMKEEKEVRKREKEVKRKEKEAMEDGREEGEKLEGKEKESIKNGMNTPTSSKRKLGASSLSTPTRSTKAKNGNGSILSSTPATATSSAKRKRPTVVLPISPPRTPVVRGRGAVSASGSRLTAQQNDDDEDGDTDDEDEEEDKDDEDEDEEVDQYERSPTPTISRSRKGKGKETERDVNPFLHAGLSSQKGKERNNTSDGYLGATAARKNMTGSSSYERHSTLDQVHPYYRHQPYYRYGYDYGYGRPSVSVYETPSLQSFYHQPARARYAIMNEDEDVDMNAEVDIVGDGDVQMQMQTGVEGMDLDEIRDWRYYDNVKYAPSLRYGQIGYGNRQGHGHARQRSRSASPSRSLSHSRSYAQAQKYPLSYSHSHSQTQTHPLAYSNSHKMAIAASSSSSSSSGSASSSPSSALRVHAPVQNSQNPRPYPHSQSQTHVPTHLSRHAHVLAPPSPPSLSPASRSVTLPDSTTTTTHSTSNSRMNDSHRLGGRIEHSRTHLSSHMAKTLRSGPRD